jgi:hypothetical protein
MYKRANRQNGRQLRRSRVFYLDYLTEWNKERRKLFRVLVHCDYEKNSEALAKDKNRGPQEAGLFPRMVEELHS